MGWGGCVSQSLLFYRDGPIRKMGDIFLSFQGQWEQRKKRNSANESRRDLAGHEAGRPRPAGRGLGLTTGCVEGAALGGGHPEVGRSCVKDDFEGLGRGANANLAIVLGL